MRHRAIASVLALVGFTASPLHAGGDIDPGFGDDGKVVLDAGSALYETQYGLARDGAGALYIAGRTAADSDDDGDFVVAKLDASGAPIASFGNNGKAVVDFGGDDTANVVLVAASGDLYVAGYSDAAGSDQFAVAKLDANGQLATGFGDGGRLLLDFGGTSSAVFAATMDAAGNVYLAGTSNAQGTYDFTVAKLDASGALDDAFGDGGIAAVGIGAGADDVNGIAIDAAGDIVVAGTMLTNGFRGDIAAIKLDASGHLVPTFGNGGKVTQDIGEYDFGFALALDTAGAIYVAGQSGPGFGDGNVSVVKWTAQGDLDASFGDAGILLVDVDPLDDANADAAYEIIVDADGDLYVGGSSDASGTDDFIVKRIGPSGMLDPGFGANGIATIDFGGDDEPRGLALSATGEIYLAGTTRQAGNAYLAATRLTGPVSSDRLFADGFDP